MENLIFDDVTRALGIVPTVKLQRIVNVEPFSGHELFLKLESCNPGGSIKEKNAAYLVDWAEREGKLAPGGTIIESSSGNFGIGLAMVGAARGYRVIIVVDTKTPPPVRRMLKAYGAFLEEVSPAEADPCGSLQRARMARARRLAADIAGSWYPCQHENPVNIEAHSHYTAREIDAQFGNSLDAIVVGVSTAGQIMGIARYYKEHHPTVKIIGVDVAGSQIFGMPGKPYKMTGVGLSFVPPNLDAKLIDACFVVPERLGFSLCHELAKKEGLLLGASTGIIVAAGLRVAASLAPKKARVLMINPDRGDRYLETIYDEKWLKEHNFSRHTLSEAHAEILKLEPVA